MTSHGHSHLLTADASVRPSLPEDAPELGRIQHEAWKLRMPRPDLVPEISMLAAAWQSAIDTPPSAKHRMLTACAGPHVVGFAAIAPVDDALAEVITLEVDPDHRRTGHGSRLLAACADILRQTGAQGVRTWSLENDDARLAFLASAGFAPLGVRRMLSADNELLNEVAFAASFD